MVADGAAYVSRPQTRARERVLRLATSHHPVIFAGCLMRMAEADTASLVLMDTEVLAGHRVSHLAGLGGSSDALGFAYWLGVENGLPRQTVVRTSERPG